MKPTKVPPRQCFALPKLPGAASNPLPYPKETYKPSNDGVHYRNDGHKHLKSFGDMT